MENQILRYTFPFPLYSLYKLYTRYNVKKKKLWNRDRNRKIRI